MFNMPLTNSLAGTIDPTTGKDACPISPVQSVGFDGTTSPLGITSMIVTCPKYEADGKTFSPLAGQAVIANLYPGRYGVVATPAADRIARGEEWLQTNTLDGQKATIRSSGSASRASSRSSGPRDTTCPSACQSGDYQWPEDCRLRRRGSQPPWGRNCTNTVTGIVTTERMSRTPDERLYGSGDNSSFAFTQCYVSFGDPDGEDFAFTKCNADGTFTLSGLPDGTWRITVFDQWNDMLVDGLSTPVALGCPVPPTANCSTVNLGQIAMNQWQANIYTRTFFDQNGDGVSNVDASGNPTEPGLALVATNIRFRDGSFSNFNNTDLNGFAGFNEVFPLFSWYVVETDTTRYKSTGTHVVYDAAGPLTVHSAEVLQFLQRRRAEAPKSLGTWRTQPNRFRCPRTCVYRARSIATKRIAPDSPLPTDRAAAVRRQTFLLAESIRLGLKARDGRAFPARTRSLNSARSPSQPAKTAASMAMSCTLRPVHLTIRNCSYSSVGSRRFRMSP